MRQFYKTKPSHVCLIKTRESTITTLTWFLMVIASLFSVTLHPALYNSWKYEGINKCKPSYQNIENWEKTRIVKKQENTFLLIRIHRFKMKEILRRVWEKEQRKTLFYPWRAKMWCAVMSTGNIQRSCVLDGGPSSFPEFTFQRWGEVNSVLKSDISSVKSH